MSTSHASDSPKSILAAAMDDLKITIHAEFVPWSKSRSAKPAPAKVTERSLNWRVTLKHDGRDVLTTDYRAGLGHCPSYKPGARLTLEYVDAIAHETEMGTAYRAHSVVFRGQPILPDACDVMASLVMDSDAIESRNFEDWASDHGYDTDSRKAEATYRACLEIGLALRAAVGDVGLSILRDAAQDY